MSTAVSVPAAPRGAGLAPAGAARWLAGTRELARLAVRRDRIVLPAWIYVLTVIAAFGGFAVKEVYKTPASRAVLAASVHRDAALSFLYGQLHGTSAGAIASWRYLSYAALAAGLMSIFLVVRHTRADEETGRLELIGSTAVGRPAPLAVALAVAGLATAVLIATSTAVLALGGLPLAGAAAFALGEAGCGLVFGALAAIAAQVSGTARGARGLAIAVLAMSFLLRGVGDSGGSHGLSWLTWLSPIGWAELVRPFAGDRWWVLAVPLAGFVLGTAAAFMLAGSRDQGAGLVQPRPGRRAAGLSLQGPAGLAWLLQRAALAGWAAGFLAGGLAIGVVAQGIGQLLGTSKAIEQALHQIGGQSALVSTYLSACMSLLGLVAAAYAVAAVLRLRAGEADGHAELLLAAPVSRWRWGGSHLLVAAAGTVAVLISGGLGVGLGYGLASSNPATQVPRLLVAALAEAPAALCVAAVAAALTGLAPRWSIPGSWAALAICGIIGVFGPAFRLPQPVLDISPFAHVPKLPGGAAPPSPLIWLCAAALALTLAGLAGLRRRDIS